MNKQYVVRFSNGKWWHNPMTYDEAVKFVENWNSNIFLNYSEFCPAAAVFDIINEEFC